MKQKEEKYYNAFNLIPNVGPKSFKFIMDHFETMEQAWSAPIDEFSAIKLNKKVVNSISIHRREIEPDEEYEKLKSNNIKILTLDDSFYPKLLSQIYDPPPILYFRGEILPEDDFSLGIVGSRKTSSYGKIVTQELLKGLTPYNITIVSGLAVGIDTEAHSNAIKNNCRTIAVLGSGLDWPNVYPSINKNLAKQIIDGHGAVISEFPIGTKPNKFNFPRRNRIISGLSKGVLVIEAGMKSGSLITARNALEQGREIFSVPGNIFKDNHKGTNNLIQQGAKLVTNCEDIVEELDLKRIKQYSSARSLVPDNKTEASILKIISKDPIYKDIIIQKLDLPTSEILSSLSLMEMKGYIKDIGGGKYILS